ncbi:ABC exporter membrane fusion protein [Calothrix sp. PCC 7507]|uniref:ABC exporter membrane fusion protein n=1 Tax=Calothrix sp. PCC 7507 TaxID=99598 RepID=UPI00029F02E1|nr:ABC exporter membrane fusion protein [Calothrix sp. PCC 7507]AFY35886.1 ABC exporter membrane fusion protein, DevB family [Calothrix sp. PCC 7507]
MMINKENQLFTKAVSQWRIVLAVAVTLATGLVTFYTFAPFWFRSNNVKTHSAATPKLAPTRVAVTALGRLQPEGEITYLSAPNSINGVRVEKLLVKAGDQVKAGQLLAYLEDYRRSTTALQQSLDKLQVAKAQLAQAKSGAKNGDIEAQKATIKNIESQLKGENAAQEATIVRLQAQLENAQKESDRYQQLYKEGGISASIADSKTLQLKTAQQQLTEAQATLSRTQNTLQDQIKEANARLKSLSEIRPVDVELAQTQLKSAMTAVKQAKADQDLTYLRAPISGTILKIHAKTGEVISTSGFAEIGKTSQMYVVAEVYQTDIQKVRLGQKATITSTAFSGELKGYVSEVGWQVDKQSIFSLNPGSDTDRKIVQVKIFIDNPEDSKRVARLSNLQVDVAIHI